MGTLEEPGRDAGRVWEERWKGRWEGAWEARKGGGLLRSTGSPSVALSTMPAARSSMPPAHPPLRCAGASRQCVAVSASGLLYTAAPFVLRRSTSSLLHFVTQARGVTRGVGTASRPASPSRHRRRHGPVTCHGRVTPAIERRDAGDRAVSVPIAPPTAGGVANRIMCAAVPPPCRRLTAASTVCRKLIHPAPLHAGRTNRRAGRTAARG